MKNKDEELALKRYDILEPYISKKKSLKDLSEKNNISYSTLKRWAGSYKKHGLNGLKKSERSDKSTYRTLNNETMIYIKEIYKNNPNLKILDYYNKIMDFLKHMGAKTVSYDTVYRVINQLDPYIKDCAGSNFTSAKSVNEILELEYFQLDCFILDERDDTLKKPYLNIIYDNYSETVSEFLLSFDKITLYESLALLRNAILSFKNNGYYGTPGEFIINNLKFSEKDILENLKNKLNIQISFSLNSQNKLQDFFDAYNNYYLKETALDCDLDFKTLSDLTGKYINKNFNKFRDDKNYGAFKKTRKIKDERELDILLTPYTSKRKVKDGAVRFQNLLYEHPLLYKYEDLELEVRYNPFDLSKIKVYDFNFYVCDLSSETIGKYPVNYYDFLCIKKAVKNNFASSGLNLKNYANEFREFVKIKYAK